MDVNFYKYVLNHIKDGVYFVDKDRKLTFWNKKAEQITGFKASEILGRSCSDNILNHVDENGCQLCRDGCPLHQTLLDGKERENTVYLTHKDGQRIETKVYILPIEENGEIVGAVETFNVEIDEEEINKNIEKLKVLAYEDQLTGLPNRRYIDNQLEVLLTQYNKMSTPFGIAVIDIDHFKVFNDQYGHDTGDEVLKLLARVFQSALRGNDFIGRWGGEEFVAVLTDINKSNFAHALERLRVLVENSSLPSYDPPLKVTVSIGASLVRKSDSLKTLFNRADKNLYKSKKNGRNQVTL